MRLHGCCVAAAHASHNPTPSQPHAVNKTFISDVVAVGASSIAEDGITILGLSFPELPTKAAIPLIAT